LLHFLQLGLENLFAFTRLEGSDPFVVLVKMFVVGLQHLSAHDLEADPLKTGKNFAHDTAHDCVRLKYNECSFHAYPSVYYLALL
jgi:hypothetical protein